MKTAQLPPPPTFLLLPADDPSSGRPEEGKKPNGHARRDPADRHVILLIDDSDQDHALIAAALGDLGLGASLRWARGHEEARNYLSGRPPFDDRLKNPLPSLIFLDLEMPVSDGFSVLTWLRSRPSDWQRVPVVMLTTRRSREEIVRAYDMGANSYIVKPTGYDELLATLKAATDYWLKQNRGT